MPQARALISREQLPGRRHDIHEAHVNVLPAAGLTAMHREDIASGFDGGLPRQCHFSPRRGRACRPCPGSVGRTRRCLAERTIAMRQHWAVSGSGCVLLPSLAPREVRSRPIGRQPRFPRLQQTQLCPGPQHGQLGWTRDRAGHRVEAWSDYWQQFRDLLDLSGHHGFRVEVTIFAGANT